MYYVNLANLQILVTSILVKEKDILIPWNFTMIFFLISYSWNFLYKLLGFQKHTNNQNKMSYSISWWNFTYFSVAMAMLYPYRLWTSYCFPQFCTASMQRVLEYKSLSRISLRKQHKKFLWVILGWHLYLYFLMRSPTHDQK